MSKIQKMLSKYKSLLIAKQRSDLRILLMKRGYLTKQSQTKLHLINRLMDDVSKNQQQLENAIQHQLKEKKMYKDRKAAELMKDRQKEENKEQIKEREHVRLYFDESKFKKITNINKNVYQRHCKKYANRALCSALQPELLLKYSTHLYPKMKKSQQDAQEQQENEDQHDKDDNNKQDQHLVKAVDHLSHDLADINKYYGPMQKAFLSKKKSIIIDYIKNSQVLKKSQQKQTPKQIAPFSQNQSFFKISPRLTKPHKDMPYPSYPSHLNPHHTATHIDNLHSLHISTQLHFSKSNIKDQHQNTSQQIYNNLLTQNINDIVKYLNSRIVGVDVKKFVGVVDRKKIGCVSDIMRYYGAMKEMGVFGEGREGTNVGELHKDIEDNRQYYIPHILSKGYQHTFNIIQSTLQLITKTSTPNQSEEYANTDLITSLQKASNCLQLAHHLESSPSPPSPPSPPSRPSRMPIPQTRSPLHKSLIKTLLQTSIQLLRRCAIKSPRQLYQQLYCLYWLCTFVQESKVIEGQVDVEDVLEDTIGKVIGYFGEQDYMLFGLDEGSVCFILEAIDYLYSQLHFQPQIIKKLLQNSLQMPTLSIPLSKQLLKLLGRPQSINASLIQLSQLKRLLSNTIGLDSRQVLICIEIIKNYFNENQTQQKRQCIKDVIRKNLMSGDLEQEIKVYLSKVIKEVWKKQEGESEKEEKERSAEYSEIVGYLGIEAESKDNENKVDKVV